MSLLVSVQHFRIWAGATSVASVPDGLVLACLDEAEASILVDVDETLQRVQLFPEAVSIFIGEQLRRAQRIMARRNSPELQQGAGELGWITVPVRDADSPFAISRIRTIVGSSEAVA